MILIIGDGGGYSPVSPFLSGMGAKVGKFVKGNWTKLPIANRRRKFLTPFMTSS
jgi:hypothetical protein